MVSECLTLHQGDVRDVKTCGAMLAAACELLQAILFGSGMG